MTYTRLAYDDQDTTRQMHVDCAACAHSISLSSPVLDAADLTAPVPSITYADYPRETAKAGTIEVDQAAVHLASRLHLHWD